MNAKKKTGPAPKTALRKVKVTVYLSRGIHHKLTLLQKNDMSLTDTIESVLSKALGVN